MRFTLPQNPQAEAAVLGAIFQDESVMGQVAPLLTPEDLAVKKHGLIYQAMLDLDGSMEGITIITVRERLNRTPEGRQVTDHDLAKIAEHALPSAAIHHARILREYSDRRRLVQLGQELTERAGSGEVPAKDLLREAEREIYRLSLSDGREQVVLDPQAFAQSMESYEAAKGLPTGLDLFDQHIGGLLPGNFLVVAGRPGIGKTILAVQVAIRLACTEGLSILFCSLDMPRQEIGWRVLTILSPGRTHLEVRRGRWQPEAIGALKRSGFHIADEVEPTIERLNGLIHARVRERQIQAVFVDHIGKVRGTKREKRYEEVAEVARGLKAVARELQIPVLALCQLNREVEKRSSPKPRYSDLRDSGAVEEEADVVAFLWTTEERLTKPNIPVTLSLAKNRHGGLDDQRLVLRGPYVRFDPSREAEDGPEC